MKKQFDIPRTVDFLKNRAPEIDHPIQQRPELHDYTSRIKAGI